MDSPHVLEKYHRFLFLLSGHLHSTPGPVCSIGTILGMTAYWNQELSGRLLLIFFMRPLSAETLILFKTNRSAWKKVRQRKTSDILIKLVPVLFGGTQIVIFIFSVFDLTHVFLIKRCLSRAASKKNKKSQRINVQILIQPLIDEGSWKKAMQAMTRIWSHWNNRHAHCLWGWERAEAFDVVIKTLSRRIWRSQPSRGRRKLVQRWVWIKRRGRAWWQCRLQQQDQGFGRGKQKWKWEWAEKLSVNPQLKISRARLLDGTEREVFWTRRKFER